MIPSIVDMAPRGMKDIPYLIDKNGFAVKRQNFRGGYEPNDFLARDGKCKALKYRQRWWTKHLKKSREAYRPGWLQEIISMKISNHRWRKRGSKWEEEEDRIDVGVSVEDSDGKRKSEPKKTGKPAPFAGKTDEEKKAILKKAWMTRKANKAAIEARKREKEQLKKDRKRRGMEKNQEVARRARAQRAGDQNTDDI